MPIDDTIALTVWIIPHEQGFAAINYIGTILETNKHKSTLEYVMRQHLLKDNWNYIAIATVVLERRKRSMNKPKQR